MVCTQTEDGCMQTYWPHHVTLAYLAATEPRWQGDLAGKMEEMMRYFFTHSKGGCMINEHHWILVFVTTIETSSSTTKLGLHGTTLALYVTTGKRHNDWPTRIHVG